MPDLSKHYPSTNGSGIVSDITGNDNANANATNGIGNANAGRASGDANAGDIAGNVNTGNGVENAGNGSGNGNASNIATPFKLRPSEPAPQQPSEERMQKANTAFERFKSLQVDPKAAVAARRIITTCTVRRPKNNEFIRVNVDEEPYTGFILEDKDDDAHFIVSEGGLPYLYAPPPLKTLVLTVNQNGAFFLWPVPVDDRNTWNESARKAYQLARTQWVKLVGDRGESQYHIYLAEGELPPPRWSDKSYWELVDLAFPNSKIVDNADHEVVLKARTGQSRK
jgi:hypothetical protein